MIFFVFRGVNSLIPFGLLLLVIGLYIGLKYSKKLGKPSHQPRLNEKTLESSIAEYEALIEKSILANEAFHISRVSNLKIISTLQSYNDHVQQVMSILESGLYPAISEILDSPRSFDDLTIVTFDDECNNLFYGIVYDSDELWQNPVVTHLFPLDREAYQSKMIVMPTLEIPDISERIAHDFGDRAGEANTILAEAINKTDYLSSPRIVRCIVYLSKGNIEELKKNIDVAIFDTRDVMVRAEYDTDEFDFDNAPEEARNFNRPFE